MRILRSARMFVQARENECSVTSLASSECVLKIAGLLPGLPHLLDADERMPMSECSPQLLSNGVNGLLLWGTMSLAQPRSRHERVFMSKSSH
jgi:hypothetical protein